MKIIKVILMIIGIIFLVIIIGGISFKLILSQGVIAGYEIGKPDMKQHILIASQKSAFKTSLVNDVTGKLKDKDVFIKVIDVTGLPAIKPEDWNAIVLINTCEAGKMQKNVADYLKIQSVNKKTVLVTTSGSGDWKPEYSPVDCLSTASIKDNTDKTAIYIVDKLKGILDLN
jgi:hypothetical protein